MPRLGMTNRHYGVHACYDLWTKEWEQLTTCRMTKIFFPKPDKNKTKKLLKHGRAYMRRLIECTTGHNYLNYLQSKIYPEDVSELCRFCEEEPETFDHLLNEKKTSQVWHPPQPTHHQHTKMGLRRHNSILPHPIYWWSTDIWITTDQLDRFWPGLPLTLGTGT